MQTRRNLHMRIDNSEAHDKCMSASIVLDGIAMGYLWMMGRFARDSAAEFGYLLSLEKPKDQSESDFGRREFSCYLSTGENDLRIHATRPDICSGHAFCPPRGYPSGTPVRPALSLPCPSGAPIGTAEPSRAPPNLAKSLTMMKSCLLRHRPATLATTRLPTILCFGTKLCVCHGGKRNKLIGDTNRGNSSHEGREETDAVR
jgi:hypothetical protein